MDQDGRRRIRNFIGPAEGVATGIGSIFGVGGIVSTIAGVDADTTHAVGLAHRVRAPDRRRCSRQADQRGRAEGPPDERSHEPPTTLSALAGHRGCQNPLVFTSPICVEQRVFLDIATDHLLLLPYEAKRV